MIALSTCDEGAAEATDSMRPPTWAGNFWGPAATRARMAGKLPFLASDPRLARWRRWGDGILREGDIVFRMGDARTLRGLFPLSAFIAKATGSPYSHTGIVAIEDGLPVVYDCSSSGVQRQPFEVWMLDCVGAFGVKRLKPKYDRHIPGVIAYCRKVFEQQVPFDYEFRMDDDAFYCLELTEKAFRSQGLALSEPVRIGDWEHLVNFPLTALAIPYGTGVALGRPITLEQTVYLPGNEREGVWASPLLETVFPGKTADKGRRAARDGRLSINGDLTLVMYVVGELRRSYSDLPLRFLHDYVFLPMHRESASSRTAVANRARPRARRQDPPM